MSRLSLRYLLAVVPLLALAACSGSAPASSTPSVDPTAAQLQQQLDDLPAVDGAQRTAHDLQGASLTETFTVPAGSPACLQILSRLDAGGYEVVVGTEQVAPTTCRLASGAADTDTTAGKATILARGGSEIALAWTTTTYTVTVAES